MKSISTLRTRLGYAEQNWLFYVTGGLGVTNENSAITKASFTCGDGSSSHPVCSASADLHPALAAGLGAEYGITPNLSAKAEWLWIGSGAVTTLKENTLRMGLNYRFGMYSIAQISPHKLKVESGDSACVRFWLVL